MLKDTETRQQIGPAVCAALYVRDPSPVDVSLRKETLMMRAGRQDAGRPLGQMGLLAAPRTFADKLLALLKEFTLELGMPRIVGSCTELRRAFLTGDIPDTELHG